MKHLLTMNDLTISQIQKILDEANEFSKGMIWKPPHPIFVSNLFFEPSTRTKLSFEVAQRKLGFHVIPFEASTSSILKGESLYDTVKTLQSIGVQMVVIRHQEDRYFNQLKDMNLSIINGGDGCGHHPTQCLLDLFTIQQEFGTFEQLKVAMIGDISHSRVARSNVQTLHRLGAKVLFSGPPIWKDEELSSYGEYVSMDEAIETADVVMLLRIQFERHKEKLQMSKQEYHQSYGLTRERMRQMKDKSIIMHPAPVNRGVEIADELVECERSRIFKQMENGVFVRMAVLKNAIEEEEGDGITYKKREFA